MSQNIKKSMNPKVDEYLGSAKSWQKEMERLRKLLLGCQLEEDLKWGKPCYTFENNNVAILQGFKESCALMFFKGALLTDPDSILERPGDNSQAARRIMFTSVREISGMESQLKDFILQAIDVEKAGKKVKLKETKEFAVPEEFQYKLKQMPSLKKAFDALTPGRQRAYLLHFSGAKQSSTRASRVEKCVPQILAGKGLND